MFRSQNLRSLTKTTTSTKISTNRFFTCSSLIYSIFGISVLQWGDRRFVKLTILFRLTQVSCYCYLYVLHVHDSNIIERSLKNISTLLAYTTLFLNVVFFFISMVYGLTKLNNIETYAHNMKYVDNKFKEFGIEIKRTSFYYFIHVVQILVLLFNGLNTVLLGLLPDSSMHILEVGLYMYTINLYAISTVIFIDSVYTVYQRFKTVNDLCTRIANDYVTLPRQILTIKLLLEQHQNISKNTREIMKFQSIYLLLSTWIMFSTLLSSLYCLYLFVVYQNGNVWYYHVVKSFISVSMLIGMCVTSTYACVEGNSTAVILQGVILKQPLLASCAEVLNFEAYLRQQKIVFKPYDYFNIDNRLLMTLSGALITHLILLIQTN